MNSLLLVMLGGAVGAGLRHLVGQAALAWLDVSAYPWGTLAVNLTGGLAMGLLVGGLARFGGSEATRLLLGVGVLGGFTTFSAFSLEVMLMIERGDAVTAIGYALASVIGSVVALGLGLGAMRTLA